MTAPSNELRAAAASAIVDQGRLRYPDSLPISERRDEILDAIRTHQVVIVAGETGSGKSTQLPKLCLEAGRGVDGMIGHTQPRRVAARTIAERVADELGSPLGTDVGYTVRFTDQVGDGTLVKVMTDGILLAEIQRDRMLRRYDTLIIDEAHERSLNIDFILGFLKQLLPLRPDLHVIVTSATIDTDRFAEHFGGCPVIEVTGRTYPVEVRYRPFGPDAMSDVTEGESPGSSPETAMSEVTGGASARSSLADGSGRGARDDRDQVQAIVDAVEELRQEGPGDVLVFLSGEREIHDTADALRRLELRQTEVLPLYARLSSAEQHRIFERPVTGGAGRRIVLATNVAETSLTVPGVRYVVDAGSARISRYSRRLKVQRLPIEPVSQASANQRAGRCGRVAPGICIRLYAQDDFDARPEFTEPEILRTNLASVILQMTAIGLGDVARFPFVEPPEHAAIRDGYQLLDELAALRPDPDGGVGPRRLTKVGERLARLPVDPRLGRMVLEAERLGCVREVLVIASGLSIQDPRERPQDKREQAAEFHNRFRVDGSDLLGIVALWDHLRERQRALSGNQFRRMCRTEFLNYLRVREWMDLFSQLRRIAGQLGIRPTTEESHPDHVHQAVLSGLLSHLGMRDRETKQFIGARQSRFVIAPGSALTRRPPSWVMAAELVETNQLYARRVAKIDPKWAERASAHIHKRSHDHVRWDPKGGRAVATESVTLYGLPIVSDRTIGYDRVDHAEARAWFITKALIERDVADTAWLGRQQFLAHNEEFLERIRRLAVRVRRLEVVDDEMLFEFYDDRIGDDVTSVQHFDRWWKQERRARPDALDLTEEFVARSGRSHGVRLADFPDVWRQTVGDHTIELPLTYRYAPGEPLDGVTVHVPLAGLNQVRDVGFDWQIPGHRAELVTALVRSLPKTIRRQLIPLGDTVDAVVERMSALPGEPPEGRLVDVLAATVGAVSGASVAASAFDLDALSEHLRLHFVVSDDEGTVHAVGTDLDSLRGGLAGTMRDSIAAAAPIEERRGIVDWDLGDLPRVVESTDRAMDVRAYPTLLDVGDSVALRVVTTPELQQRSMRGGVRRLLLLNGAPTRSSIVRQLDNADRLAIAAGPIELGELSADCVAAAVDRVMRDHGSLPWTRNAFDELRRRVRDNAPGLAANGLHNAARVVAAASQASALLARLHAEALRPSVDDANAHLGRLVHRGFVLGAGLDRLDDIERYVRGIVYRLERLAGAHDRDRRRMDEIVPLEQRYASIIDHAGPGRLTPELADLRWQLEDLRVVTFAQPLALKRPGQPAVSTTRIAQTLARA